MNKYMNLISGFILISYVILLITNRINMILTFILSPFVIVSGICLLCRIDIALIELKWAIWSHEKDLEEIKEAFYPKYFI